MRLRNLLCYLLVCFLPIMVVLSPIQATSKGYFIRSGNSLASEINFQACMNEEVEGKVTITANNENTGPCEINITWTALWLDFNPTRFVLSPGSSREVKIMLNTTGLTPDRYATNVVILSNYEPKETLLTVTVDVLAPQLKLEPDQANWSLPFIGESSKEIYISSKQCHTSFELTYEPKSIPDLSIHINPLSSFLDENKPVKVEIVFFSQGFMPIEPIRFKITFTSPYASPITGEYRIDSLGEVPIKTIYEILSGMPIKDDEYMIHGYGETKAQIPSSEGFSKMTFSPFSQITLDADYFDSYLEVNDPDSIVEWDPLTWPKMSYAKVHGLIKKGSDTDSGKMSVKLTKPIKHYFELYYPYKPSLWNFYPEIIPFNEEKESADRAIIIGSSGFPSDWVDVDILNKWAVGASFNASPKHLKVFYSLGVFPDNSNDTPNVKEVKQRIKPYMMPGKFIKVMDYLAQVEIEMRNDIQEGKNPSLTVFITGYSSLKQNEPCFFLSPTESFTPKDLAGVLERISILGPVKIQLNTSHAGSWEKELLTIGNLETIFSCRDNEDVFYHSRDFESLVTEYLKSGKAGNELGKVNWKKLVSDVQINIPFYKDGAHFESKTTGEVKYYCQSKINPSYYLVNGDFVNLQKYRDPREKFEYKTSFNMTFPVLKKSFNTESIDCTDYLGFDPPDLHLQSTPYYAQSTLIDTTGLVIAVDKKVEEFQIETPDGIQYRILYPVNTIPVKIKDKVRIRGSIHREKSIIPDLVEVLEQNCKIIIDAPKSFNIYPTCFSKNVDSMNEKEERIIEWTIANQGEIPVEMNWTSIIDELTDEVDITFTLEWIKPSETKLRLLPGESQKIQAKASFYQIPERLSKEVKFRVSTKFYFVPSPPCEEFREQYFDISICPNRRIITGKVYFQNIEGNPCAIKNFPVRLYLRYDPVCKTDNQFQEANGNVYQLEDLAFQNLPNKRKYLQTTTDENGEYSFDFYDYDGKEEYRIVVVFEKSEFRMTYGNGFHTFFVFTDINQESFQCKEVCIRNIAIGYDKALVAPSGIIAKSVAQSLCHIDECFAVFMKENCGTKPMIKQEFLPLSVCVDSDVHPSTCYDASTRSIHLVFPFSSPINQSKPQNCEWHEFGHFLTDCLGVTPTIALHDKAHNGVLNSSSACSLVEGLAEIISVVILKEIEMSNTCCKSYTGYQNGLYRWSGGVTDFEHDAFLTPQHANQYGYISESGQWVPVRYADVSVNSNGKLVHRVVKDKDIIIRRSFEEFAVASLLLDLIDSNEWYQNTSLPSEWQIGDDDPIQNIPWQDLLCLFATEKISDIEKLYSVLIDKYHKNHELRRHIVQLFVDKGFYEDSNHNGQFDGNEKIGSTFRPTFSDGKVTYPEIKSRPDVPLIKGSAIKVHLVDSKNVLIPSALIRINVMTGKDGFSFTYTQEVINGEILHLYLTPNSGGKIRLSLANGNGKVYILTEEALWKSVGEEKDFVEALTLITDEQPEKGEWQWSYPDLENSRLIQNRMYYYAISYWNTGNSVLPVNIESTSSWLRVFPETIKDNAGSFMVRIDTSKIGLGTFKSKIYIKQNNHIVFTIPVSITNLSPSIFLQLRIGQNKALIDEKEMTLDSVPYIKKPGRTMVPMRFIAEGFGASLDYAPKEGLVKDIWVYFRYSTIHLTIGSTKALVDGRIITIDAPAEIVKGRTFVPIRAIAEIFGAKVEWEASTQTISIHLDR